MATKWSEWQKEAHAPAAPRAGSSTVDIVLIIKVLAEADETPRVTGLATGLMRPLRDTKQTGEAAQRTARIGSSREEHIERNKRGQGGGARTIRDRTSSGDIRTARCLDWRRR
ncbi:MAG: hypothetical protein P4L87_10830 [Formivibrio sp.]|nr:hypothetical protein [Formivibrio sp.]